jgi:hypothetical protein
MQDTASRPEELQRRLADLRARWPRHTVTTAMALETEELEEEITRLQEGARGTEPGN